MGRRTQMNRSITGGRRTRGRGRMVGGEGWFDTSSWGDKLNGWKRKATDYASGTDAGYDVQPMPEAAPMPEAVNMPAEAAPMPEPAPGPPIEGGRRRPRKSRKSRKGRKGRKSRKHTTKRKSRGRGRRSRRGRR